MTEIPNAPVRRIMKYSGAIRVSEDAANELTKFIEEETENIARKAVKFAEHAGRKTVTAADVKLAV